MSLEKSPAGVPWNVGLDGLIKEETRIYSDRLTEDWMKDATRRDVLIRNGLSDDQVQGAMKIAATGVWGFGCDQVQAGEKHETPIQRAAGVHERGYHWATEFPFSEWESFVQNVVVPMFKEGDAEI